MRIVKGNKKLNIDSAEFNDLVKSYDRVEIDLGTGDGRFVFKNAITNPKVFYVGIDPSEKQLEIYSRKAIRNKVENVLFVIGSVELLPPELTGIADMVNILFPWGTLLQFVTKPEQKLLMGVKNLLKPRGELEIVFGYSPALEPSETKRLDLPEIDETYIRDKIIPKFEAVNFSLIRLENIGPTALKALESTWIRKIRLTTDRPLFIMQFTHN